MEEFTTSHHERVQGVEVKKDNGDQIANIKYIPLYQRGMLLSNSAAAKMPTTNLHRMLKAGNLRPHNNTIKPLLISEKK